MPKRLYIIRPSHYRDRTRRSVSRVRRKVSVSLALPYLAALTPEDWEVKLTDEQLDPIDYDRPVDLVALTVATMQSLRAWDVADEFHRRGVPVIAGGPHVFFHPEEASEHCDAIGIGEAENIWTQMLEDAAGGKLRKVYRAEPLEDLSGIPPPRYDLLDLTRYGSFRTFSVQSSRGCPLRCDFCSERLLSDGCYRCRPAPEVAEEIRQTGCRYLFFADSNFGADRAHAVELMESLIELNVRWSALWSTYRCLDKEFMDLAQKSGLLHLNIGVESIDAATLSGMKKTANNAGKYTEMLAELRRRGISYSLNFIFGWDGESPDALRSTMEFLRRNRVPAAYFNILTPLKGTPLFDRMQSENRIINADDIGRWPGLFCYFKPSRCTPEEMENSVRQLYRQFYSVRSIIFRLPLPWTQSNLASWFINLRQLRMTFGGSRNSEFEMM